MKKLKHFRFISFVDGTTKILPRTIEGEIQRPKLGEEYRETFLEEDMIWVIRPLSDQKRKLLISVAHAHNVASSCFKLPKSFVADLNPVGAAFIKDIWSGIKFITDTN